MTESSSRVDKGQPLDAVASESLASSSTPLPSAPESVWENAFDIPVSSGTVQDSPHAANGDNTPTVISRAAGVRHPNADEVIHSLRGRRLAHFELIAPIGVGGMAAVIKGRDLQLDRTVALKILPPDMAADAENVRRFQLEARAAAKLDHENIARVFYCGEDQRLHFIAFEFVQGDNLRTILDRRGKLPVNEALHYILQVTTGLAHAASRGVVHRDIKPSNIIITPTGRAKLVDMGLARNLATQEDGGLTQSGVTLGTFDYISPEQAMEPRAADTRSDIYSLGCTFYHMLTGRPPVPEGTAAKKLHCHQHEKPIDPRQLSPDVPDEVAVILSTMMAKEPRARYQTPEKLVEHLLRVAQKLEAGGDRHDGLLYVDAPVPARPTRPLLLVGLAILAVVAVVFALEYHSSPHSNSPAFRSEVSRGQGDSKPITDSPPLKQTDKKEGIEDPPPGVGAAAKPDRIIVTEQTTLEELREFASASEGAAEIEVILKADLKLELKDEKYEKRAEHEKLFAGAALSMRGKKVTVRAENSERRTIILVSNSGRVAEPLNLTTALFVQADQFLMRGLRLVVDARKTKPMTGVYLRGGKSELDDCQFVQDFTTAKSPITSVLMERFGKDRPELRVTDCAFVGGEGDDNAIITADRNKLSKLGLGGAQALVRRGAGLVHIRQSVFGPHLSCIRLEGDSPRSEEEDVQLAHCSVLLEKGSAVLSLDGKAETHARARYCLFSRPVPRELGSPSPTAQDATVLFRQTADDEKKELPRYQKIRYFGSDNRYHGLDGFWADVPREVIPALTDRDFATLLSQGRGADNGSRTISSFPWDTQKPLIILQELDFNAAFKVEPTAPELRADYGSGLNSHLIGAERCDRRSYIDRLPALSGEVTPPEIARKEKIVNPALLQSEPGHFKTLSGALSEAQPGDVILINHNGKLPMMPIPLLDNSKLDVIIRPQPGSRPVLTLSTTEKDAVLFRLKEGQIRFQELEFYLEPPEKDFQVQAAVAIFGDGRCHFERCTITLGEPQGCTLAAVILGDPDSLMRRPLKPGEIVSAGPSVTMDRCVVRGKGDLLWCRASRPFQFRSNQLLAVLSGSLASIDGSKYAENVGGASPLDGGPRCDFELKHVTAAVAGPLFQLRPQEDLKSIVPLKLNVADSLLFPLAGKPVFTVSGLNVKVSDLLVKERLGWSGSHNAYGKFAGLLEQQPTSVEMMRLSPFEREKWKDFSGEMDAKFLDGLPYPDVINATTLLHVRPKQLQSEELKEYGINPAEFPDVDRDDTR